MTIAGFNPDRAISTLTIAELEQFIQTTIQKYTQQIIPSISDLDAPFDATAPLLGDLATDYATQIPDELWQTVPEDASEKFEDYLYQS